MAASVLGVALWQPTPKSKQRLPNHICQEDGQLLPYIGSYETLAILNWNFRVSSIELNQWMASQFLPVSILSSTIFCLTLFTLCLVPGLHRHLSFLSDLSDHWVAAQKLANAKYQKWVNSVVYCTFDILNMWALITALVAKYLVIFVKIWTIVLVFHLPSVTFSQTLTFEKEK